jgi:hypothetical protein
MLYEPKAVLPGRIAPSGWKIKFLSVLQNLISTKKFQPMSYSKLLSLTGIAMLVLSGLTTQSVRAAVPHSTWTKGHKKVLVIPVRFTDAAGPSNSDPNGFTGWNSFTNGTIPAEINSFFIKQSFNQFSVDFTILPEVNLGVPTTYYTNNQPGTPYSKWTEWGSPGSLADDARAKARAIGLTNGLAALYESANYDFDVIATGYMPGRAGAASDGGRSVVAFNYFTAIPHELGHCLGLQHANGYSRPTYYSPVVRGSFPYFYFYDAYGDVYCLMGWKEGSRTASPPPDRDMNPFFKYELGWLTDEHIVNPGNTSGTYRVHAFDQGVLDAGKYYAMRIARDPSYTYWFDFRQAITNLPDAKWSQNGLEVHFGAESARASSGATQLIDMTPDSRGPTNTTFATMHDAPLLIGRTYSDAEANLHVTPIKKGGTTPESLDVVVNFGPFPTNHAPTISLSPATITLSSNVAQTFTATASDPDGDMLAYYWEFDDPTKSGGMDFGGLSADSTSCTQAVHSWTQQGVWSVRCTVTDMKGGRRTASATVTVTNGIIAPLTISGLITDEVGNPLEGASVNNFRSGVAHGATNFAGSSATAADGKYQIVVPRNNSTYKLAAMLQGYAFSNSLGGTVTVANASVANVNFTRVRTNRTVSGGVYVAGRSYNSTNDGALTVSDGSQSVIVSNGGWQLNIPDGSLVTLTATATNPAYTVSSDFPKPYLVVDDVITLSFFVDIPGSMPLTGFTSSGTNSDDTVGTVGIPVVLTLPPGLTNWPGLQSFAYWIDNSSTAEYGVDYKMRGGIINFYGGFVPSPFIIPLTIIHDAVPKNKTVVIKLAPGNSIANLGPISTYTYTISNPPPQITGLTLANSTFSLTWPGTAAARYTIESTLSLTPATWTNRPPHTNLPGFDGPMTQIIAIDKVTNEFFRVKTE